MNFEKGVANSRKLYIPFYLMVFALIVILAIIFSTRRPTNELSLIAASLFILSTITATELHRFRTKYSIEESYLVENVGILSKKIKKVAFPSISDVNLSQTFWQRLLGFGTVHVYQFSQGSVTQVKNINTPELFLEKLGEKINKNERAALSSAPF